MSSGEPKEYRIEVSAQRDDVFIYLHIGNLKPVNFLYPQSDQLLLSFVFWEGVATSD